MLGWVRGLFLPPVFDSWPLPLVAVLLHLAAALLAPLLLRLKSSGAGSKRAAILARMPSADGALPPPPPPAGAGGAEPSKSFVDTIAHQMGLGPLLGACVHGGRRRQDGEGAGGLLQMLINHDSTITHIITPRTALFKVALAAWQDVLLFSFAFFAAVALASASERVFLALMREEAAGPGTGAGTEL